MSGCKEEAEYGPDKEWGKLVARVLRRPEIREAMIKGRATGIGSIKTAKWAYRNCIRTNDWAMKILIDSACDAWKESLINIPENLEIDKWPKDVGFKCVAPILLQLAENAAAWYVMGVVAGLAAASMIEAAANKQNESEFSVPTDYQPGSQDADK